jgi:5-methylcytosine-specific restriction endonuclease McrA
MFDSHICDYNYKCLTFTVDETGWTSYTPCPHDMNCDINHRVRRAARGHYNRHSTMKGKKESYASIPNPSVPIIKSIFQEFLRSGFKCVYCGQDMTLERNCGNSSTIDHITARALGGSTNPANLTLCCWDCNQKKAQKEDVHLQRVRRGKVMGR